MSKEFVSRNNIHFKYINNDTLCIFGNENSSNYFVDIDDLLNFINKMRNKEVENE